MNSKAALKRLIETLPALTVDNADAAVYHELVRSAHAWVYETNARTTTFVARFAYEEVVSAAAKAWRQGPPGSDWHWEQDYVTIATVACVTTRARYDDYSGVKKWRVVSTQAVTITVYLQGGRAVALPEMLLYGGEVAVMAQLLSFGSAWLYQQARLRVEDAARVAGLEWYEIAHITTAALSSARLLDVDGNYWQATTLAARLEARAEETTRCTH